MNFKPSVEIFQVIIENTNDIIAVLNKQYQIEFVNESSQRVLDHRVEDVIGKIPADFVHPDDLQVALKELERGFQEGEGMEELRLQHKNGEYYWFEIKGRRFIDKDGNAKVLLILRDVTERIKTQKELELAKKKYQNIVENTKDAIIILGFDGYFKFASPQLSKIVGEYKFDETFRWDSFIHPNDLILLKKEFFKAVKEKRALFTDNIEFRVRHKDGNYIWVEGSNKDYYDEKGKIIGFISCLRDVTEKKNAEQKLKESEERYRLITENAYDMISIVDQYLHVNYCNHVYTEALDFSREELKEMELVDLIHPDDYDAVIKELKKTIEKEKCKIDARVKKKDGTHLWVEIRGKSYVNREGKTRIILILRDIENRRITELRLKSSLENLEKIYKNKPI